MAMQGNKGVSRCIRGGTRRDYQQDRFSDWAKAVKLRIREKVMDLELDDGEMLLAQAPSAFPSPFDPGIRE
jgi:hypothetical protein